MKELFLFLTLAVIFGTAAPSYQSFGNIDIQHYKNNKHALDGLYTCIVDNTAACDPREAAFRARGYNIVRTFCEDCTKREEKEVRDLFSLIGNDNPDDLRDVLQTFDPKWRNTRSFLDYLRSVPSLAGIPFLRPDVVNQYYDTVNFHDDLNHFKADGGILGAVGNLLGSILNILSGNDR